ncbi:MAG: T9SS C-terminal target domain-containing protein, partial [Saprospiraceae bacterium]|nr:T9SS C-terminal target domain-containing protein [Saprospiraceae bacterium]
MKKNLLSLLFLLSLVAPGFAITDVCSITVSPDSKVAAFANGEDVTVYLSYTTDQPAGVRIYVRPYSNGSLSPNYTADASPIYYGSGVANSS